MRYIVGNINISSDKIIIFEQVFPVIDAEQDGTRHIKPGAATNAYNQQLGELLTQMSDDFHKAADAHVAEAKTNLSALIYDVTRNVRPGSENAVEIVKTAIDNAFKGYEQVTQATRDAVKAFEQQVEKASAATKKG